jgi:hypothetical protein
VALPPASSDPRTRRTTDYRAAQNEVFMREVDEAVRQDEMVGALRRYGIPLAVAIVLGLAALGGWLWWHSHQAGALGERGEQFAQALDQVQGGHFDAGDKALAPLAAKSGTGIGANAAVMRAAIAEEQAKGVDASKQFASVSADADAPQVLRDLATVREVAANFDAMPPQQVVDRLKPLAVPGNPWFGNAGELLGMAYMKQGKRELAGPLFASIARDDKSSDALRGRARQLAALLGVDAIDDVAKSPAAGNSAPAGSQ